MFNVSTDAVNATHLRMSGVTLGSEYNNCTCSGAPTSHYPEVPVCSCARAFTIELYIFSAPHYFYDREYLQNERKFSKQALYGFAFPKNKFGFGLLTDALTRGCEYFYTVTAGVRSDSETFICTGRASAAYRNAVCCGANLSAIFTSGCPRNENGRRSGRVQTRRFTELRSTQRCVFSAVV